MTCTTTLRSPYTGGPRYRAQAAMRRTKGLCDQCGKEFTWEDLIEVNPEGGWGRPRYVMCDECLEAAPEGSFAAKVRDQE